MRGLVALAALAGVGATAGEHRVPLMPPAADAVRQGFVRVINHGRVAGEVSIEAIDDAGSVRGPIILTLPGRRTRHFNSDDLEFGNPGKGVTGGTGPGQGNWRLVLSSDLDIEVLPFIRTRYGFVTTMREVAPRIGNRYRVPFFNPGSNTAQVSRLRLTNPGAEAAEATVTGVDDAGVPPGRAVTVSVPPGATREFTAAELESGAPGLQGALGDGQGKWSLFIESDSELVVLGLLESPTGHWSNLTGAPRNVNPDGAHIVPFFPAAGRSPQGFVRVINHSAQAGEVAVAAFDDSSRSREPVLLSLEPFKTVHFNSDDLELGNPAKGLSGGVGAGDGAWRLQLTTGLEIDVLAYLRTADGFVTSMHDVVRETAGVYRAPIFNPGSNRAQASTLRLANPGPEMASVTVSGVDDVGVERRVAFSLPGGGRRTFTSLEMETGTRALDGRLGDGVGKWRLIARSDRPLEVVSLLASPEGHVANLSASAPRPPVAAGNDALFRSSVSGLVQASCVGCHVRHGAAGDTRLVFVTSAEPNHQARNLAALGEFVTGVRDGAASLLEKATGGGGHGGGRSVSADGSAYADLAGLAPRLAAAPGLWLRVAGPTVLAEGGTTRVEVVVSPPPAGAPRLEYVIGPDGRAGTDDAGPDDFAVETTGGVEVGPGGVGVIEIVTTDDDEVERADGEHLSVRLRSAGIGDYEVASSARVVMRIDEGICDRTPAIRDSLLDAFNDYQHRHQREGVDGCLGVRDAELMSVYRLETGRLSSMRERDLHGVSNLRELDLCRDRAGRDLPRGELASLPDDVFAHTPALARLVISGCSLSDLPEGLADLDALEYLGVNEPLTRFPSLPRSGTLTRLGLSYSRLRALPARAFADTGLETIGLTEHRDLVALSPDTFAGLPELNRLSLSWTGIRDLPPAVFSGLPSLVWLQLAVNRVESLEGVSFPPGLEHLNLNGTPADEIPSGLLAGLTRLRDFRYERYAATGLRIAPGAFRDLTALGTLQLAENGMAELPAGIFEGLASLRNLRLNHNALRTLPDGLFDGLTALESVDLSANPGAPFPVVFDLERVDGRRFDPGPARLRVRSRIGFPVGGSLPVSTYNATVDTDAVRFERGAAGSAEFGVTGGGDGAAHVGVGPVAGVSRTDLQGLDFRVGDPVALFERTDNRMPLPARAIPGRRLQVGGHAWTAAMGRCFHDVDGDTLTYTAESGDPAVVVVAETRDGLAFEPLGEGSTTVTVTAADPSGIAVSQDFRMVVEPPPDPSGFHIALEFVGPATDRQRRVVREAADRWTSIITGDLPDVPVTARPRCDHGVEVFTGNVDDLRLSVSFSTFSQYAGLGAPNGLRDASGLPFTGEIELNAGRGVTEDSLRRTALHEMGHALGFFPPLWGDYFRNPSRRLGAGADTHFSGPLAIAAFDEAGGAGYTARSKVPLDNSGAVNADVHWAFRELMDVGGGGPLSAITVQLFADIGYEVDAAQAEPYRLPRDYQGAARRLVGETGTGTLSPDLVPARGPTPLPRVRIRVVDGQGAVLRVFEESYAR